MSIDKIVQTSNPGELITLLRLDLTKAGDAVYYLTPNTGVVFGGQTYQSADIEMVDMKTAVNETMPMPKIRISNTNMFIQQIVNTYGDNILGCEVRRVRTFKRFLDGQPEADSNAYIGPDVFQFERKSSENPIFIEYELSASLDQEGKMLPGRQIIRDTCSNRYRYWNGTSFDYSKATCPYAGTSYFKASGETTTAALDRCGRKITDCWLRFGKSNPVPFAGFPGAARVRV